MSDIQKSIQNALDEFYKTIPTSKNDTESLPDEPQQIERTPIFFSDEEKLTLGIKPKNKPINSSELSVHCKIKEGKMVVFIPENFDISSLSRVEDGSHYIVLDAPDMRLSCIQALKVYKK